MSASIWGNRLASRVEGTQLDKKVLDLREDLVHPGSWNNWKTAAGKN
jgi:hypothetical protein